MTTTAPATKCIVLARVEEDFVWDGKPYAVDLGQRAGLKSVKRPVTLVWCLRGDAVDTEKAHRFARAEGYSVLSYPVEESDPLARAKRDIMRRAV
jgi:hypothetical protein